LSQAFLLPFEEPLVRLRDRIDELSAVGTPRPELAILEAHLETLTSEIYARLSAWEKVQLCRHPLRPTTLDYIGGLATDFVELCGDRNFADDKAIVTGMGSFRGKSVAIAGHRKGRSARENAERNFGMPRPEGYRKAKRLFELADQFNLPIVTFIDTAGAHPGLDAEERGQSEAIGSCIAALSRVTVPVVSVVVGEGGSGGALALGVGNCVLIQRFATYSVITPEGCASILWRTASRAPDAADRLKVTSHDLFALGAIDNIVDEPARGAHVDPESAIRSLGDAIAASFEGLRHLSASALREQRYARFRAIGRFASSG
jgi:acetyl-CoA carboxylase carboxyl transferase subunit alpha